MRFSSAASLTLLALAVVIGIAPAARAEPPSVMTKGQWTGGCDNQRTCTALGFASETPANLAAIWLRLDRGGAAKAVPKLSIGFTLSDGPEDWPKSLTLSTKGGPSVGPFPTEQDEAEIYYADVPKAKVAALLGLIGKGGTLTAIITEEKGGHYGATLSLEGAADMLAWIDAEQQRTATATALIAPGTTPVSVIPSVPKLPKIHRAPATEAIEQPALPDAILALAKTGECADQIENVTPMEADLGKGKRLYGVSCPSMGDNTVGQFWIMAKDGKASAAVFELPRGLSESGAGDPEARGVLSNAGFDPAYMSMTAFAPASRGSDCGAMGEWVYDGTTFRLLQYSLMSECRKIPSDGWPTFYHADAD